MAHDFEYHSLPGVAGGKLKGTMSQSASGVIAALRQCRVTSAAGDHGSLTAWIDDDSAYRAAFHRWQVTKAEGVFTSQAALRACLKSWWPALRDPSVTPTTPENPNG